MHSQSGPFLANAAFGFASFATGALLTVLLGLDTSTAGALPMHSQSGPCVLPMHSQSGPFLANAAFGFAPMHSQSGPCVLPMHSQSGPFFDTKEVFGLAPMHSQS